MIASSTVKHSFLVPPVFILIFLAVFISLAAVDTIISFGGHFSDTHDSNVGYILQRVPYSMAETLPASVLLTILMMLFRLIRSQGNKLITSLLHIGSAFFVLVFGLIMLVPALPPEKAATRLYRDLIEPQRLNKIGDIVVFPQKISGNTLSQSLVVDSSLEDWKLGYAAQGEVHATPAGLEVALDGFSLKTISSHTDTRYGMSLESNSFIRGLFSAFRIVSIDLRRLAGTRSLQFYILCFAFVFFFASSGVLLKITKWPLLNLAFLLFVTAGTLFMYAFYQTQVVPALGKVIRSGLLSTGTPTLVMIILGLLFFLVDLIFIPSQFWRKEIEGV
jgi:hypothetical protein